MTYSSFRGIIKKIKFTKVVFNMKAKHVLWIASAIVAVTAMAVGIAVLVDRYISRKECPDGYLTFDSDELDDGEDE